MKEIRSLAILILTCNEEENIVSVVQNAKKGTDEVIIIDSGSTDHTLELAEKAGAKVVFRAWTNDFSAQRNFALEQTTADWVLYLDADERLNEELIAKINQIVAAGKMDSQYTITRKTNAFGKLFNHGVLGIDHVIRLFPRKTVTWVNKVHEHPECDLPMKQLPGFMEHYTYKDWHEWEGKLCLYTTIWAEDSYKKGKRISMSSIFGHSIGAFFKMFILNRGFLDGGMGTCLCFAHAFYTMLKYLKLYELQQKKS